MKRLLLIPALALGLAACEDDSGTPVKNQQAQKAAAAANSIHFTENAEIDNIKKRLELTSSPGLLGYVTLINRVGQTVLYTPVQGKITSGSKRLTPPDRCDAGISTGKNECWYGDGKVRAAPSDEGTWGSSNEYVFFWTPGGQYFQTSLDYVYSDKPYRLREEPLIDLSTATVVAPIAPAKP